MCVGCPVDDSFALPVAGQGQLAHLKMADLLKLGREKTAEWFLPCEIQSFDEYAMPLIAPYF